MPKSKKRSTRKGKARIVTKCFMSRGKRICRKVQILASGKWKFVKGTTKLSIKVHHGAVKGGKKTWHRR